MHPLLDDLVRRRIPAGSRWRDWAAMFAARHVRIPAGVRAAGVLLTLPVFRQEAAARNTTTLVRWSPQISVGGVIHAAPRPPTAPALALHTLVSRTASAVPAHMPIRSMLVLAGEPRGRAPALPATAPVTPPFEGRRLAQRWLSGRRGELTARPATPRFEAPGPAQRWPSGRRGELTAGPALRASRTTLRQLVHERHRIEVPYRAVLGARPDPRVRTPAVLAGTPSFPFPVETGRGSGPRSPEPMVVRRPPPPPLAAAVASATSGARGTPAESRPAIAPSALTRPDLGRLTDQVVEQIDRRIVAHRERLGRI